MKANCTICCDLFDDVVCIAATTCGHTFHELCLLQWMEHSRTCPACRKHITQKSIIRLFFTCSQDEHLSVDKVKNELDALKAEFKILQMEKRKMQVNMDELRSLVVVAESQYEEARNKFCESNYEISSLKLQLRSLRKELTGMEKVNLENSKLRDKLLHFQNVQTIINGCDKDISDILQLYGDNPAAQKQMATYCALLKMELNKTAECKRQLQEELKASKKELVHKSILANNIEDRCKKLESENQRMKDTTDLDFIGPMSKIENNSSSFSGIKRKMSSSSRPIPTEHFSPLLSNSTFANNLPAATKKPKINFMSSAPAKLSEDRSEDFSVQSSFFKPKPNSLDDSIISVGYNGMGGHSRHIVRRINPIPRNKNSSRKKSFKENVTCTSNRIDPFLS